MGAFSQKKKESFFLGKKGKGKLHGYQGWNVRICISNCIVHGATVIFDGCAKKKKTVTFDGVRDVLTPFLFFNST